MIGEGYPLTKFAHISWEYVKNTLGVYILHHHQHHPIPLLHLDISLVYIYKLL